MNKYQAEETEFLEEQGFEWEKFGKDKWCWLIDNEKINEIMIKKYFISVLLPYYIIKRDLARSDLKELGFNPFLIEISHYNYHLNKIKEFGLGYNKRDLVKIFGEEKTLIKLERAEKKINCLIKKKDLKENKFYSDIEQGNKKIYYSKNLRHFGENILLLLNSKLRYGKVVFEIICEETILISPKNSAKELVGNSSNVYGLF